jgi:hypothetical protein
MKLPFTVEYIKEHIKEGLKNLLPNNTNLEFIYLGLIGSRIWGTFHEDSDWDFVLLVETDLKNYERLENPDKLILDFDEYHADFDVWFSKNSYIKSMKEYDRNIVIAQSLPKSNWIIGEPPFQDFLFQDKNLLRSLIGSVVSKGNHYAKLKFKENNKDSVYIAKKNWVHAIRWAYFGVELLQHGKIRNYEVANKFYNEIMMETSNDVNYYIEKYAKGICKKIKNTFSEMVHSNE